MRQISQVGIDLVKFYESFKAEAYICPAGILTIGYGHTGPDVKKGMVVTIPEAEELLRRDLLVAERAVSRYITRPLTDNQFAALVSFTFNAGGGALQSSSLRKKCNRLEDEDVQAEFAKWVWGGGRKLPGLIKRRKKEAALYGQPDPFIAPKTIPIWEKLFPGLT